MKQSQREAIKQFFNIVETLKRENVIRSDEALGDIGEFLCAVVFDNLELVLERKNPGYDATLDGKNIQIKFSNSSGTLNIDLGDPNQYAELIVVLGKNSAHRNDDDDKNSDYLFYRYTSAEVKQKFNIPSGSYKLSKTKHYKRAEEVFNL